MCLQIVNKIILIVNVLCAFYLMHTGITRMRMADIDGTSLIIGQYSPCLYRCFG